MNKLGPLLATVLVCSAAESASAAPIHATFDGTVTGSSGFFTNVLADIPIGTTASFDVFFDDAPLVPMAPLLTYDVAPVSGSLTLGALHYVLDAGAIWTYTYNGTTNEIISYGVQLTGSGPGLSAGSSLFGLFLRLAPDLTVVGAPLAGFRYPVENGEYYSYADLAGTFSAKRVTSVPEPSTALLLLSMLPLLWYSRRTVLCMRSVRS